jgi:hypothetical protein
MTLFEIMQGNSMLQATIVNPQGNTILVNDGQATAFNKDQMKISIGQALGIDNMKGEDLVMQLWDRSGNDARRFAKLLSASLQQPWSINQNSVFDDAVFGSLDSLSSKVLDDIATGKVDIVKLCKQKLQDRKSQGDRYRGVTALSA